MDFSFVFLYAVFGDNKKILENSVTTRIHLILTNVYATLWMQFFSFLECESGKAKKRNILTHLLRKGIIMLNMNSSWFWKLSDIISKFAYVIRMEVKSVILFQNSFCWPPKLLFLVLSGYFFSKLFLKVQGNSLNPGWLRGYMKFVILSCIWGQFQYFFYAAIKNYRLKQFSFY